MSTPETAFSGRAVLTPFVQENGVLVVERRSLIDDASSCWCPVAKPAWDGYVAWPRNLPRWECYRGLTGGADA